MSINGNNVVPMKSPEMPDFFNGHISALCKRIKEGSILEITPMPTKYVPGCRDIIRNYKLLSYIEKFDTELDEEYSKIWIYAPSFYTLVLKEMLNLSDDTIRKIKPNQPSIHQFSSKTAKVGDNHDPQP